MRLVDYLMNVLVQEGVTKAFGITGRGSLFLNDAVARSKEVDFVPLYHEQDAGFASLGFSSETGRPSVCMVSSGVGSSNALTPLVCAWQDQVPVIFLSGQNQSWAASALRPTTKRTYGDQELDLTNMVQNLVKSFFVVSNPGTFPSDLQGSLQAMLAGRPGPIWIDVPLDFQSSRVGGAALGTQRGLAEQIGELMPGVTSVVRSASRPVLLVGPTARHLPRLDLVFDATIRLGLPVVCEAGGENLAHSFSPNFIGAVGKMGSNPRAQAVLESADLVVSLGSTFRSNLTSKSFADFLPGATFLVIDLDRMELPEELNSRAVFLGPSPLELWDALEREAGRFATWISGCQELVGVVAVEPVSEPWGRSVDLHELASALPSSALEGTSFVTDSGFCDVILPSTTQLRKGQKWHRPFSQGSMGAALGMVAGLSQVSPRRPIVAVIGDGSLMMNVQALQSAAQLSPDLKIILIDNDMYGIIKLRQSSLFRGRKVGVDADTGVGPVDWGLMAAAFGFDFEVYSRDIPLDDFLTRVLSRSGLCLIKLEGAPDQGYWGVEEKGFDSRVVNFLEAEYQGAVKLIGKERK